MPSRLISSIHISCSAAPMFRSSIFSALALGAHYPQGSVVQVYPSGWDNGNDDAGDEMAQEAQSFP